MIAIAMVLCACANDTPQQIQARGQAASQVIGAATGLAQQGFQDYKSVKQLNQ